MGTFRNHRQRISYLLESINGRGYCLTDKINPNHLLESINGRGYSLTDKINLNHVLILIKLNPLQPSIIIQVNSSTQLQPIRSLIGVLRSTGDVQL